MTRPTRTLIVLLLALAPAVSAWAKAPTLDHLYPAGGRRGQTIEVTAGGGFDPWPVKVWVQPGRGLEFEPGEEKGRLRVTIASDAAPGIAWVRLYNEEGASSLRPFVIGSIAESEEVEPNDAPGGAMAVESLPITIHGRLAKRGDVDGFAVRLESGQRLVASALANREIGSPMDGVLQVASSDGFVLAHIDDRHGFDPQVVFEAPTSGTYVVRLFAYPATPDSTIRPAGGDGFVYRLTLTTGGFADHPWPLAVRRGEVGTIDLTGWNLPDVARRLDVPEVIGLLDHPGLANAVAVGRVAHPSIVEAADLPLEPPVTVTGRIGEDGERDAFRLTATKDASWNVRAVSRGLGFPLDPVIRILDASGKVVAEADDNGRDDRDPTLTFKAPADGQYRVVLADLNDRGGPRHVYRLDLTRPRPDYRASAKDDRVGLTPGESAELAVSIDRIDGHAGAIRVAAEGLPPGVRCEPAIVPAGTGKDAKAATLTFTAGPDAAPFSGPFRLAARPAGEFTPGQAVAFPTAIGGVTIEHGWLTVTPPKPAKAETPAPD